MFVLLSALLSLVLLSIHYQSSTAARSLTFTQTQLEEAATPSTTTDGGINHDEDLPALPALPIEWQVLDNIITFPQAKASTPDDGMEVYTIRELKKMASFYGVKRYSSLTKAQLITAIRSQVLYPQAV